MQFKKVLTSSLKGLCHPNNNSNSNVDSTWVWTCGAFDGSARHLATSSPMTWYPNMHTISNSLLQKTDVQRSGIYHRKVILCTEVNVDGISRIPNVTYLSPSVSKPVPAKRKGWTEMSCAKQAGCSCMESSTGRWAFVAMATEGFLSLGGSMRQWRSSRCRLWNVLSLYWRLAPRPTSGAKIVGFGEVCGRARSLILKGWNFSYSFFFLNFVILSFSPSLTSLPNFSTKK